MSDSTLRTRGRDLGIAAIAGAALTACVVGWASRWFGPSDVSVWPLLGLVAGLALGCSRRVPSSAALLPLGTVLLIAFADTSLSLQPWIGGLALGLCGAGAGSHLRGGGLDGATGLTVAVGGATLVLLLTGFLPSTAWLVVGAILSLSATGLAHRTTACASRTGGVDRRGPASFVTAGVALRLGCTFAVAAGALAFLAGPSDGTTVGLGAGAARVAAPLVAGLLVGLLHGAALAVLRRELTGMATEALGWALLGALACKVPVWLHDDGWTVRAVVAIAAALGGVSLSGALRRGGAWGLLAIVLAWPAAALLLDAGARSWTPVESVALAMGKAGQPGDTLLKATQREDVRVRFSHAGPGAVHVVDVRVGEGEHVRLLAVDGQVRGGTPTHAARSTEVLLGPVLEAALPLLFAPDPPGRVAVLGLGTGVQSGVVLAAGVDELAVVEPVAGVVAAHHDPGDLFGFVSHRPLEDPRTTLHRSPIAAFLRAQPAGRWDAIVGSRLPLDPPFRSLVPSRAPVASWSARRLSRAQMPQSGWVYAFFSGDGRIIVLQTEEQLSLARLRERLESLPGLRAELERVGLSEPMALLARLVAGPGALLRPSDLGPEEPMTDEDLREAGAATLGDGIDFGDDDAKAAEDMASLAEHLSLVENPGSLPLAFAAAKRKRTGRTLRILGDLLLPAGRQEQAIEAWRAALELEPESVSTRLSLAVFYERVRDWRAGLEVLTPAVGKHPERDAQVRFHVGKLAIGAKEFALARKHLRRAKGFSNASDLLLLVDQLAGPAERRKVPPAQKLEAAERLLNKARVARDPAEATRLWDDTVAALLSLAHDPSALSKRERLRLSRLLEKSADSRGPAARRLLRGLEAKVLAPYAGEPRIDIRRARAMGDAGQGEEAEVLLAGIIAAAGPRKADAQRALGDVLAVQEKWEAAVAAWQRYLDSTEPGSAHVGVYQSIAEVERRRNRLEHAVRALQAAERLQPHPTVRLNLGTLLLELGRRGQALEAYRGFLQIAPPNHPQRRRVQKIVDSD